MLDFPTSRQDEIAIDVFLGDDALQSRHASVHFIARACRRALEHETSGASLAPSATSPAS
jgi:hypothetical protein